MNNTLDERYASALLTIANEEGKNFEYRDYIKNLVFSLEENKEIIEILSSKFMHKDEKKKVVEKIMSTCPFQNIINLMYVIIDNGRERNIISILKEFISLSNELDGISEGIIYTSMKLTNEQIANIEKSISSKINKKVYLTQKIDHELIGGIKVCINDYVFDASIKNKLDSLKHSLNERR